jgi:mono/diheme cytochrome c family protein
MRRTYLLVGTFFVCLAIYSCNNSNEPVKDDGKKPATDAAATGGDQGIGNYKNVTLTHPLNEEMVGKGKNIYEVKCLACHKTTEEKVVGPGWKGVTDRRTPEYILNFVTNTDEMLDKDPNAKALLSVCMVRMPNQHLTDNEARSVLEFMRKNDGKN